MATSPIQLADLSRHVYPFIPVAKLIPVNSQFLWMDLSQPERAYIFGTIGIPTLAVLVVITTYLQSKLMTPMSQPGEQGAQMGQMMNLYMPFFMGYLALTFSAGLALYFIASNVITVAQYAIMGKVDWSNLLPKNLIPKFALPKFGAPANQLPEPEKPKAKPTTQKPIYPSKKKKSSKK